MGSKVVRPIVDSCSLVSSWKLSTCPPEYAEDSEITAPTRRLNLESVLGEVKPLWNEDGCTTCADPERS
eukprot:2239493-Amphidinium_carterae.3